MMRPLSFARWKLNSDVDATKQIYATLTNGAPEECGCDPCRNFAAQRTQAYPPEVLKLLAALGIASNREAEVYHLARLPSGRHLYGGWFHFAGEVLEGRDAAMQIAENVWRPDLEIVSGPFKLGFTSKLALVPRGFQGWHLVQLEFNTELPWTLDSREPE